MSSLCRACFHLFETVAKRCPKCASPRVITHSELTSLSIAHMDCDAFYASVEKRDNPDLRNKAVIIGGLLIIGTVLVVQREITLGQFVASEVIIIFVK